MGVFYALHLNVKMYILITLHPEQAFYKSVRGKLYHNIYQRT